MSNLIFLFNYSPQIKLDHFKHCSLSFLRPKGEQKSIRSCNFFQGRNNYNCSSVTTKYSSFGNVGNTFKNPKIRFRTFKVHVAKNATLGGNNEYNQKISIQLKNFFKNYKYEKLLKNYKEFNKQINSPALQGKPLNSTTQSPSPLSSIKKVTTDAHDLVTKRRQLKNGLFLQDKAIFKFSPVIKGNTSNNFDIRSNSNITYNKLKTTKKMLNNTTLFMSSSDFIFFKKSVFAGSNNNFVNLSTKVKNKGKQNHRTYHFLQTLLAKYLEIKPTHQKKILSNSDYKSLLQTKAFTWAKAQQDKPLSSIHDVRIPKSGHEHFLFNKINNKSFLGYWLIPVAGFAFITPNIFYNLDTKINLIYYNNFLLPTHTPQTKQIADVNFFLPSANQNPLFFDKVEQPKKAYNSSYVPYAQQYGTSLIIKKTFNNLYNFIKAKSLLSNTIKQTLPKGDKNQFPFSNITLPLASYCHANQKTILYDKIIFKLCAPKYQSLSYVSFLFNSPKGGNYFFFLPLFLPEANETEANEPKEEIYLPEGVTQRPNPSKSKLGYLLLRSSDTCKGSKTTHLVNTVKSILYLSTINPLYSKTFVNNSVNFIDSKKALKLLTIKIIKLNNDRQKLAAKKSNHFISSFNLKKAFLDGESKLDSPKGGKENISSFQNKNVPKPSKTTYYKTLTINKSNCSSKLLSYNNNIPLRSYYICQRQSSFDHVPEGEYSYIPKRDVPEDSYKEGLDLINLNLKNQTSILGSKNILNESKTILKSNKLNKMIPYCVLYKQNTVTLKQPILNSLENKNQVLLNYFLFNHKVIVLNTLKSLPASNEYSHLKNETQTTEKNPLKLKLNLIKSIIDSSLEVAPNIKLNTKQNPFAKINYQLPKPISLNSNLKVASSLFETDQNGTNLYVNYIIKNKLNNAAQNTAQAFDPLPFFPLRGNRKEGEHIYVPKGDQVIYYRKKGSTLNLGSKQFLNSLSVLFKHQKMFKNKIGSVAIRLHLQKKRKAKKQRLETRRQKKRTRFFPRPIWLRYRTFLNFINQRKLSTVNTFSSRFFPLSVDIKHSFITTFFKEGSHFHSDLAGNKHQLLGRKAAIMYDTIKFSFFKKAFVALPLTFPKGERSKILVRGIKNSLAVPSGDRSKTRSYNVFSKFQYFQNYFNFPLWGKNSSLTLCNYINSKIKYKKTKYIQKKQISLLPPLGEDIKKKANYINFKNQKSNNPPPPTEKDKDKDTMFRDFWIWIYNCSLTNNYGQNLWSFLPNNTSNSSINKTKQTKNVFAIARIYWALNKTNNNSFTDYNKRYNLWGTQKLRNQSKNNKTKFLEKQFSTNWEKYFLSKNLNAFYKKISSKLSQKTKKLNYLTSFTNNVIFAPKGITKNIKIFNTTWWSNLNLKTFLNNTYLLNKQHDIFLVSSGKTGCSSLFEGRKPFNFNIGTLLISSSLLLHLCAVISLVSISQVRCFVKFHLILLYKLSNVYNSLIYKISDSLQPYIPKGQNQTIILAKMPINKSPVSSANLNYDIEKRSSSAKSILFSEGKPSKINLLELRQNQKKLLTYFSLNLLKRVFNQIGQKTSNDIPRGDVKSLKIYLPKERSLVFFFLCFCQRQTKQRQTNQRKKQRQKEGRMSAIYSKLNIISSKTIFLKHLFISNKTQPLTFKYKINQTKFYFKKNINALFKAFKNMMSFVIFNLIDLFQSSVRTLSSFFEKPAEFTTTWIAYGFLVEWSSDLITIIPENVDIYIWNVFSKISRIMPIQFVLNFNSSLLLSSLSGFSGKSHGNTLAAFLPPKEDNQTGLMNISSFPVLMTMSHLLHRRILHLFDILLETISQPDSDLIARQEKGTLFWDIWADFLVTAADFYNVNVAALSTIKAEQNILIENISNDFGTLVSSKQTKRAMKNNSMPYTSNFLPPSRRGVTKKQLNHTDLESYFEQSLSKKASNIFLDICSFNQNSKLESVLINLNRWSVNQYITYQSWHSHNGSNNSNGDLFIDYHPPKSFSHIPGIKYNSILQQPIGTLVCQIYSGIFNKQISKNILLVNTKTTTKQVLTDYNILLIQALAGETELKIITDNAQRYALVNRGFAIGIKLLRDVFDAIALNTPCIFLLEDIHAIGERRLMLISDSGGASSEDNGAFKEDFFGSQRDEVHEKNQVVYQLTRHAITHYKKPFKGDYSLAIPTNLYLTDLFLKLPTQSTSNLSLIENHNLTIKNKVKNQSVSKGASITKAHKNSHQEIAQTTKNLAPPSTSPFSVLLLKEEKRLKPNKIVEELPWTGLPGEQLSTKPRTSYSVRAKVALLAELSLSNLSAKLDMITDLLVIIDSVRSNKGFVVFATTDIPHVLDPALRRPGRLDETICLPNISNSTVLNFNTNYEIIKSIKPRTNLTIDYNILNTTLIYNNSESKGKYPKKNWPDPREHNNLLTVNLKDYNTVLGTAVKQTLMGLPIAKYYENASLNYALISHSKILKQQKTKNTSHIKQIIPQVNLSKTLQPTKQFKKNKDKAKAYYEVGKVLLNYYLNNQYNQNNTYFVQGDDLNLKSINYLSLYTSKNKLILQLMLIFGGKIGQLLGSKNLVNSIAFFLPKVNQLTSKVQSKKAMLGQAFSSPKGINSRLPLLNNTSQVNNKLHQPGFPLLFLPSKRDEGKQTEGEKKRVEKSKLFEFPEGKYISSETMLFLEGENHDDLKIATSIMLSFIHKRYLYRKNLIVPKLLSFTDGNVLEEPPCPPFSSLLIPAKRFENYKRVFRDSIVSDKMGQRKAQIPFIEKLQYHTQLRSIKQLNNTFNDAQNLGEAKQSNNILKPLVTAQQDERMQIGNLTTVPNETLLQTTTNINWYYQNRILKRHGQYLTNQWWNGQLSEHNAETVFLSDIDWRSSFIKNKQISVIKSKNLFNLSQQKNSSDGLDILLDFPDTDQYYNPRRRRWLLNKGYWSFWFNFDKVYSEEIISTWILESIIQTYTYLHNNTELLDFVTSRYIVLGYPNTDVKSNSSLSNNNLAASAKTELSSVKEIILTNSFKRF